MGGLLVLLVCWRMHQQQRWDMRLSYVATGLYSGIMLFAGYGIGTLTLSGTSDYSGTTKVSAGTLTVTGRPTRRP